MYSERSLLGQSKSGVVYRAVHPQTGEPVLLKLMPYDGQAPNPLDAAKVVEMGPHLQRLGGMNIARLLAVEHLEDGLGLISEYVQAPTLSQFPDKGKVDAANGLDIFHQLVNALCEGEKLRMIHGDVKPSNILIGSMQDGRPLVKLTDWALAQARHKHTVETLLFQAPERLAGGGPTLRGDIFSLGHAMMYLFTGMTLVKGKSAAEVAAAWPKASPEHLKKARKDLPAKLVKLITSMLELKPEKRPASFTALRTALVEFKPRALPQPPPAARSAPAGVNRPASVQQAPSQQAANLVPVQAPMRPPAHIQQPGSTLTPDTGSVNVVAMRPPPELAAQMNIPLTPVILEPEPLEVGRQMHVPQGSHTQPFVTGTAQAVPVGARTQSMATTVLQGTPRPVANATRQQQQRPRQQAEPEEKSSSKAWIYILLTVLVLGSLGGTAYYFYSHWDSLTKKDEVEKTSEPSSASDIMSKIRAKDQQK